MCFAHPVFSLYDGPLANDHVFSSPGATLYIANGSLIPAHPILSPLFPSSSLPGGAYYNCRNVMMKVWTGPRSRCWGECSWRESRARLRDLPTPSSYCCCIPTPTTGSNKLLIRLLFHRRQDMFQVNWLKCSENTSIFIWSLPLHCTGVA